jgi:hypothetical protein
MRGGGWPCIAGARPGLHAGGFPNRQQKPQIPQSAQILNGKTATTESADYTDYADSRNNNNNGLPQRTPRKYGKKERKGRLDLKQKQQESFFKSQSVFAFFLSSLSCRSLR